MKYRKGKLLLGTAFLALAVTACGGEKEADSETAQAEEAADQEEQQMEDAQEETGQTETTAGDSGQEQQSGASDNTAETAGSAQTADDSQEAAAQSPDSGTESQEEIGVPAKVRIYEATYFAEAVYRNVNLESSEWPPYCEIDISNVTDTSFDFTVYERTFDGEPQRNLIFKTHTAVFNGDGTTAVYNGQEYTLNFTFPNDRHSLPDVTEIQVTGFAPLEGETYLYNQVPGHEFG